MCGIAGFCGSGTRVPDLERMAARLAHRGPDGHGFFRAEGIGLAHARLSIIDVATGAQPMANADGSLWITFNGEIFNYLELRQELIARGHIFATRSDTEVILHLYREYGDDCVRHMNGQWAFAIWDVRARRLFLSRDRFGILPLFYTGSGSDFCFASEVKALFADTAISRQLNYRALDQIFSFWTPVAPETVFEGVWELPPAHSLVVEAGTVRRTRYWELPFVAETRPGTAEELLTRLEAATRIRLRADVPVGAYLSGGVDSSLITALMARNSTRQLETFSIGFDDAEYDESAYASEVAGFVGTRHRHLQCSAAEIANSFEDVIWHAEKPVLRTAPVPMFLLSSLVRQSGLKVVLSGEGADELFGGYDIFKETKVRRFWAANPGSRWRPLLLRRLYPYLPNIQAQPDGYLRAFFRLREPGAFDSHLPRWEMTQRLRVFYAAETRERLADYNPLTAMTAGLPVEFDNWDWMSRAQYLEAAYLMPGYILSSQGERMAMAHSVEGRFPFLDHKVAEFACRLPVAQKMKVLREKYLLKEAARELIPERVRSRPKQPYRAPGAACFFTGKARERTEFFLSAESLRRSAIFDPKAVGLLTAKFRAGRALGTRDDMAMCGIISTQVLMDRFIHANT